MDQDGARLLAGTKTVLLIDWPSRDVPDTLARGGFKVVADDGAEPGEANAYEVVGGAVRVRRLEPLPERADLVYAHRPLEELPAEDSRRARGTVEAAGLSYVEAPYIADAVRARERP